ncbi:hypothetical protein [Allostreptomyces psammosilenae]|uniref:DNA primase/polymerase bifunctional N-terminal domain-containing protein n=1 Tax=Allostreptomyces psammosilenae TaxID=1892865 RepID=A0A853A1J0_9ACTN|nr:hypothetical protein [Allostreptomyces psammosilenae]NYI08275.1 hypothetical protein [Allostreptomyces psammosilenae]
MDASDPTRPTAALTTRPATPLGPAAPTAAVIPVTPAASTDPASAAGFSAPSGSLGSLTVPIGHTVSIGHTAPGGTVAPAGPGAGPSTRRAESTRESGDAGAGATSQVSALSSAQRVTAAGVAWLASASPFPDSQRAIWAVRPAAPAVLPCGEVFDVVSLSPLFGRRVLNALWFSGPGCGPVAGHRGRVLLFTEPGTAARLPRLLGWEQWTTPPTDRPICYGRGDSVSVPPPCPRPDGPHRWIVAPDTRHPWLPDAHALVLACIRSTSRTSRPEHPAAQLPGASPAPRVARAAPFDFGGQRTDC